MQLTTTSSFSNVQASNELFEEISLPEPLMELGEMLQAVRAFLSRHIVFTSEAQAIAVSLWVAHTWVIEAFSYTPYLHIWSPVKRCGKSRVFDCLGLLCANHWATVWPSEAVLFRKIQRDTPTLLLDEVDAVFTIKNGDDGKEALRALLNAGFERRATVARCIGPDHKLMEFRVFCPKALAGIGKLPDTVSDRCIPVKMARRKPGEHIEKFRRRDAEPVAKPITDALQAWSQKQAVIDKLREARPKMPNALNDRAADICEPLLAISDLAGGEWPSLARTALVELCGGGDVGDESIGTKLLTAIREIFQAREVDQIATQNLLKALIERENDEPWAGWWEADLKKENTRGPGAKLAGLLKPFGIVSRTIREEDDSTPKGYKLASFEDAFSRYLPPKLATSRHNDTTGMNKGAAGDFHDATDSLVASSKTPGNPH